MFPTFCLFMFRSKKLQNPSLEWWIVQAVELGVVLTAWDAIVLHNLVQVVCGHVMLFFLYTKECYLKLVILYALFSLFGCTLLDYGVSRGKATNKKENGTTSVPTSSILGSGIVASNPNRRPTISRLVFPKLYWKVFTCFQKSRIKMFYFLNQIYFCWWTIALSYSSFMTIKLLIAV